MIELLLGQLGPIKDYPEALAKIISPSVESSQVLDVKEVRPVGFEPTVL